MNQSHDILSRLAACLRWGYQSDGAGATEPSALAALALGLAAREESKYQAAAERALGWLVRVQVADGSLGVTAQEPAPCWPTSLAVVAWQAAGKRYQEPARRGVDWLLSVQGEPFEPSPAIGHNSRLVGWPWVQPTHSWLEPTALAVLALQASGQSDHPRCLEAVKLLIDRLLPEGGCNYGNTEVLGQMLRPHLMPTGIVLLALAGTTEADSENADKRISRSLDYLEAELNPSTATASLAYSLLALTSHGRILADAEQLLSTAVERTLRRDASSWKLALLSLATMATNQNTNHPFLFTSSHKVTATA